MPKITAPPRREREYVDEHHQQLCEVLEYFIDDDDERADAERELMSRRYREVPAWEPTGDDEEPASPGTRRQEQRPAARRRSPYARSDSR